MRPSRAAAEQIDEAFARNPTTNGRATAEIDRGPWPSRYRTGPAADERRIPAAPVGRRGMAISGATLGVRDYGLPARDPGSRPWTQLIAIGSRTLDTLPARGGDALGLPPLTGDLTRLRWWTFELDGNVCGGTGDLRAGYCINGTVQ